MRSNNYEYLIEVARGNIPGASLVHKFGKATEVNTGDEPIHVWDGANQVYKIFTYPFPPDIGVTHYISSSDNSDIQNIQVYGLDADFLPQAQIQTLAGHTKTEVGSGLKWARVFRQINVGSIDNSGTIYCYENDTVLNGVPQTDSKISAIIQPGKNQTLMAVYTIPAGKNGFFIQSLLSVYRGGGTGAKEVDFEIRVRPPGEVFQVKYSAGVSNVGAGSLVIPHMAPIPIAEKTDILVIGDNVLDNVTAMSAYFDLLLIDY